jgi:hypothetical protein
MVGIKESKELLAFGLLVVVKGKSALADRKIGLDDLPEGFAIAQAAPQAIEGIELIPAELKDLDAAEYAELKDMTIALVGELVESEKIEELMQIAFDVALKILKAFSLVK